MYVDVSQSGDTLIYCLVARAGNFSRAARILGISRSSVSKRITRLENRIGLRLINRSTRAFSLTEAGVMLHQRYEAIHSQIEQAEREAADINTSYSGRIRLAAPAVCLWFSVPMIARLQESFPEVEVNLSIVEDDFDLIGSGFDVALRVGDLKDSNLVCKRIATVGLSVFATPQYLRANGSPRTPEELTRHNCLCHATPQTSDHYWAFHDLKNTTKRIKVSGNFAADDELALLQACLAGMGICKLPDVMTERHLRNGDLERLLDGYTISGDDIHVVLPHRDMPEKVRTVIDLLVLSLDGNAGLAAR